MARFAYEYEPDPDPEAGAGAGAKVGPDAGRDADERPAGRAGHEECYACPVGGMFAQAQRSSPDAMEHLLAAAAEFLKAARIAIDAAESAVTQQRNARTEPRPARVRRIDIS